MRELVFTVQYESGVDRLMDRFIDSPDVRAVSTACFSTTQSMWRVDHLLGSEDALDRIQRVYLDEEWCNECLHAENCESRRRYELLGRRSAHRVIYTHREEVDLCHSIPYLAAEYVGDGVLLRTERQRDEYQWRALLPSGRRLGTLFDTIESRLRDGLSLEMKQLTEVSDWAPRAPVTARLPAEQRAVLEAAVDRGYYAVPRETTIEELADDLDVPRSTLQYRLQRAEQRLIEDVFEK
ncbi:helix-turn-helix domain-containing protein [Halobellus sp. GM3]|uniref:helix-turn-helix domain-containing protein n=1 Tax=Halobellus sp. GM3 TaxID=3458410 RepID=UPI00403E2440